MPLLTHKTQHIFELLLNLGVRICQHSGYGVLLPPKDMVRRRVHDIDHALARLDGPKRYRVDHVPAQGCGPEFHEDVEEGRDDPDISDGRSLF